MFMNDPNLKKLITDLSEDNETTLHESKKRIDKRINTNKKVIHR